MDINNRQIHIFFNPSNNDYLVKNNLSTGVIIPQSFSDLKLEIEELFSW
ncbi:hypothetical protein [Cyanobacterium aponinum]|nr:hypothetical protein [Cyanobacterium aponinum]